MERQLDTANTSSSTESPPCKRKKQDGTAANTSNELTSITTSKTAIINDALNELLNEQENDLQQQQKPGIQRFKFDLPLRKDCSLAPGETLEPESSGSKSSRTGGVWYKALEEEYAAQIKKKLLLGHIVCPEDTQQRILESDILRILESEGVTEIGGLYKVSPSKFVLVFGSKASKEKLLNTEICSRFGDLDIQLDFHKRIGPLRNKKEPTFVTIYLPEFISDQAVKLAFSNFGDVVSVFKGRHKLIRISEIERGMSKSSPREEIQRCCQGKLLSMVTSQGMSFSRKGW